MSGDDPDWGTVKKACAVVGGEESPIHPATYYRGAKEGRYAKTEKVAPNVARVDLNKLRRMIRARRADGDEAA
jgi:hypothetical protein